MEELDLLILGAGWTATFLIPLLQQRGVTFAATTTDGRDVAGSPTIPFKFDPDAQDQAPIAALPRARCVLITFPLVGKGPSQRLVTAYDETHRRQHHPEPKSHARFIQLGSTGIWNPREPTASGITNDHWLTRHSAYDATNNRAVAEDELRALGGCILNLSGLWGGARNPRAWVGRVAPNKDAIRAKKSLHLIHGADVARAIAAVAQADDKLWATAARGQRWMLTDGFVYDWWSLLAGWADADGDGPAAEPSEQARWVLELMAETDGKASVRALPRSMEQLGRCYDTREFWSTFGLVPLKARV